MTDIKLKTPPRDKLWGFITGHGLMLRKGRLKVMHELMLKYGEFVELFIGQKFRTLMINHAEGVEWVMLKNAKNYTKETLGYRKVSQITGDAVFTDSKEKWLRARKLIQPFFTNINLPHYFIVTKEVCERFYKTVENGLEEGEINMSPLMTEFTLNVLGNCIFNKDLGEYAKILDRELTLQINLKNDELNELFPIPSLKKLRRRKKFEEAKTKIDSIIIKLLNEAQLEESNPQRNLIHALKEAPFKIDERFLVDQVKTIAFAGHETSANVLSWAFYYLAKETEVQDQIYAEISSYDLSSLTFDDYKNLNVLKAFVQETMRLRPPAWSFGRRAEGDDEIYGEKINAGDIITLSPYLIHHNPRYYENPEKFSLSNFTEEAIAKRPKGAYIPFGLGPRLCLGADLAMLEIIMCLFYILKKYCVEEVSGHVAEIDPLIALRIKNGAKVRLVNR